MDDTVSTALPRRSVLAAVGGALAVLALRFARRSGEPRADEPRFVERTPPGDRYRTLPLGSGRLYVREDFLRSGWLRDLRFHDGRERGE